MTDHQHGPAQGEPTEPRQPAEGAPEAAAAAETASAAPAAPASDAPRPAAPATPPSDETAPTVPVTPAAAPAPAPAPEPTAPTGTVYAPGQTPQPYHAAQYSHQPATPAAPAAQPTPQHQTQPAQYGQQATGYQAPSSQAPGSHAPAHHAPTGHHTQTQPTQPLHGAPGSVPPAFGGPGASSEAASSGQPKPRRVGLGVAAAIVAAALIGGASGAGITALVGGDRSTGAVESASTGTQNIVVNDTESVNEITAVAAKASPSVVTISVAGGQAAGTGSGIVISEDGYVLTNTHVVTLDGSTGEPTIQVEASDGRLYTADLIGTDPMSDLAVIKLQDASGLPALDFADSDELNVGDVAIAIGAPLGLSGTVTNGIVSALNRSIDVKSSAVPESPEDSREGQSQQPFDFWNFDVPGQEGSQQTQSAGTISIPVIQTDAAINPGNSGGALLDAQGRIIGVNVAILSAGGASSGQAGNIGVGFAVPANLAQRVAEELIADGSASHGLLGATVTSAQADAEATNVGALITELTPGGAAEAAGLQAGDVVTEFGGIQITDQTDLTAQVRAQAGGAKVQLTYIRGGETNTLDVTLGTYEG